MRFVWPSQRYDRLTKGPATLATAFTVVACVATAIPLVTVYRVEQRSNLAAHERRPEIITFVEQLRQDAVSNRVGRAAQLPRRAVRVKTASKSIESDTSSRPPARPQPLPATDTSSTRTADEPTPATRAIGPVLAPSAFGKVIIPEEAKDSIAKRMAAYYLKLLQTFVLTPEQKDSASREQARRAVAARDDHRALAIPLGGFSIPLGGRSREQRLKDDSVHADYVQRLARLEQRARAKRDSMLRATLAAKRDTDGRGDSLRRLIPPRPDPRR